MTTYLLHQHQYDSLRAFLQGCTTLPMLAPSPQRMLETLESATRIEGYTLPPVSEVSGIPTGTVSILHAEPGQPTISALNLTDDEAAGILTTAIEGGICYWANDGYECYDIDRRGCDQDYMVEKFTIRTEPDRNDAEPLLASLPQEVQEDGNHYAVIDLAAVKAAADRIVRGDTNVGKHVIGDLAANRDACDADAADCVLQVACFGTLVYG